MTTNLGLTQSYTSMVQQLQVQRTVTIHLLLTLGHVANSTSVLRSILLSHSLIHANSPECGLGTGLCEKAREKVMERTSVSHGSNSSSYLNFIEFLDWCSFLPGCSFLRSPFVWFSLNGNLYAKWFSDFFTIFELVEIIWCEALQFTLAVPMKLQLEEKKKPWEQWGKWKSYNHQVAFLTT